MDKIETKKSAVTEALEDQARRSKEIAANIEWLEANKSWIEEVGICPQFSGTTVLFYSPKHDQVIRIIREVGGRFAKRYDQTTITYSWYADDYSRSILLCDSQPPGSCKMIPVIETVPAHWEPEKIVKGFKLQCREESEEGTADVELPSVYESDLTPARDAASEVILAHGEEV